MGRSEQTEIPSLLIVEDDSISAFVLKKMLSDRFFIKTAKSSDEVFELLKTHSFSVILMDINLGEGSIDGTGIMQQIKSNPGFGNPAIFAVTSYAMAEDQDHFLEQGFDAYLSKPVKKEELLNAINEVDIS